MAASISKCLLSRSRLLLVKHYKFKESVPINYLFSASLHTHKRIGLQVSHLLCKHQSKVDKNLKTRFASARWCSSSPAVSATTVIPPSTDYIPPPTDYIPPPPSVTSPQTMPSQTSTELFDNLNQLGEPTLSSLGLANLIPYSILPTGWIQAALELIHVNMGLSWGASIIFLTLVMRSCMIPLAIQGQKQMADKTGGQMSPEYSKLGQRYKVLTEEGDIRGAVEVGQQITMYQKKHGIDPDANFLKNLPKSTFIQGGIFITYILSLREMVNAPVTSMSTGGFLWFPDLLASQPVYQMPMMVSGFIACNMMMNLGKQLKENPMALGMMAFGPMFICYMVHDFASGVLLYMVTTNCFTTIQTGVLKIPVVRIFFKIPEKEKIEIKPQFHMETQKSFKEKALSIPRGMVKSAKTTWRTAFGKNTVRAAKEREKTAYRKAATGPIVETFSYNPKKMKKLQ